MDYNKISDFQDAFKQIQQDFLEREERKHLDEQVYSNKLKEYMQDFNAPTTPNPNQSKSPSSAANSKELKVKQKIY